ncbi:CRN108 [Symbiodinium sp. CCMP2592]|nr:CRN108 [Symbiodinium sp. CCMP2592]
MAKRTAAPVKQEEDLVTEFLESPAKAAKILDTPAEKAQLVLSLGSVPGKSKITEKVEVRQRAHAFVGFEDDASLVQQQLALALAQQKTAQAQQETAQAQVGMAVKNLGRANAKLEEAERVGDTKQVEEAKEEVKEAKEEVKEAEQKVKEAEQKVKEAKEEVEKAEQKVKEAKQEVEKAKAESEAKASASTAQAGDFKAVLPLLSFGFAALRDGRAAQQQRDCGDWCQKLLKQQLEFGAGDALLNTIGAKWDYCGREALVRDLQVPFGVLCERKGADADKQNHPLLIAFAGPGQGKSRFLSELPAMIEECRAQLKTEKVQKYQKTLAFLITCENGTSPGDWATQELNAGRFVACRMLWQLRAANQVAFKAAGAPENFAAFRAQCPQHLVPDDVLQAVLRGAMETTIVVLGVDGMQGLEGFDLRAQKPGNVTAFYQVMLEVCRLVNQKASPLVVGCVSATQTLDHGLACSPQRRYRLALPHVTRVEENGEDKVPPHKLKDLLVRDMGGHGRALEALVQALQPAKIGDGSAAAVIGAVMFQLSEKYPTAGILGRSESKAFDDCSIKAVLRTALSGKWVRRGEKLGNVDAEKADLIRLRYNDAGTEYWIEVPYIWLHMMLKEVAVNSKDLAPWSLMDYDQFLRDPPQDGTEWEEFNVDFRVLRSWAFDEKEAVPVRSLHSGAIIQPGTLAEKMVINHHLKRFKETTVSLTRTDVLVLNAKGAPAADAVLRLETEAGELIAECLQMKHGQSACDLEAERAKACDEDDIFVVLRNSKTDTPDGQNLIFVSEGQFAKYYGIYSGRAFSSAARSLASRIQQ